MQERFHPTRVLNFARRKVRRDGLNYSFSRGAAVLVGVVAVLRRADSAQLRFERWIEGRAWLAPVITPALTAARVWLVSQTCAPAAHTPAPETASLPPP